MDMAAPPAVDSVGKKSADDGGALAARLGDFDAQRIPTVDLSQPAQVVLGQIRAAADHGGPGFFYLINHGVSQQTLDECIAAAHRFFTSTPEEKMAHAKRCRVPDDAGGSIPESLRGRKAVGGKGYVPPGVEGAYQKDAASDVRPESEIASGKRNTRESFTFRYPCRDGAGGALGQPGGAEGAGRSIEEQPYCAGGRDGYAAWRRRWADARGLPADGRPGAQELELLAAASRFFFLEPNPWPEGFKPAVANYFDAMRGLARTMMGHFERLLRDTEEGLRDGALAADLGMCTFNITHYPAAAGRDPTSFGISDHTDWELFTLLYPAYLSKTHLDLCGSGDVALDDAEPPEVAFTGLEVWFQGAWVQVPHRRGTIIVNQGEMLSRLSSGRFPAPVHRVANSTGRERYSLVSFWAPDFDVALPDPAQGTIPVGEHYLARNQFLEIAP